MIWAMAVLPLIVVLGMITGLRRPAHWAALTGVGVAVLLIVWRPEFTVTSTGLGTGAGAAGLLVLNAAAVMLPGVYLSQVLGRRGVHDSLRDWVRALPLPGPAKIALVVAGIAPMVEALTGFGVSLLVTVPVLLALAPPATALRQAMLGMNIMPWGTLGLATAIGASLTALPVGTLGTATALTSALVFPLVTAWAAVLARPRQRLRAVLVAASAGATLSAGLLLWNRLGVVAPAGVLAGLFTTAAGLALCALWRSRSTSVRVIRSGADTASGAPELDIDSTRSAVGFDADSSGTAAAVSRSSAGSRSLAVRIAGEWRTHGGRVVNTVGRNVIGVAEHTRSTGGLTPPGSVLRAYGLVLGGIAVLRLATAAGAPTPAVHAGGASFALLTSPGLPLLAAALLLDRGRVHRADARAALTRVARPLFALSGFVVLGRLMADSGMIARVGAAVADAPEPVVALAAPALGMVSGFVTGSNVGGNVLMMPLQQQLAPEGLGTWFAALQNCGAGHAVFTSLPMIMLILAVSGERAREAGISEHTLLRFGLRVAAAIYALLASAALLAVAFG
ncbi:L-lactate permease [Nocardia sp. 2]|uniref:L-lactate permease n=1 Tax=Nocardia acididurans TaxID=2802282 RepID=A0ABS1M025_9NOCA|nr:L-lactate permease [Nocardia acididurans]MBL1073846.1 L-lactate permease [Nocardia acididurans]